MNKNILMCLNKLDIGGLENVVVNQGLEFLERGYKVVILSKNGIYTKKMQESGAICIEFDFKMKHGYDIEASKNVEEIINKYDIGQVHIHQFDCIATVFPACLKTNTPYIAYTHTGTSGAYDWFEESYLGYKEIFNIYFNTAYKIIAITEDAKAENKQRYNVPDEKYIVINNSFRFDDKLLQNNKLPEKIERFLIVSRLAEEKMTSIKNSIEIFRRYHNKHSEAFLTIVGDGLLKEQVKKEINDLKTSAKMLGPRNDVIDIIKENDVMLGLDRCILETIATKKIAIISGYEKVAGMVTMSNIEEASKNNFSGGNLEEKSIDEILEDLSNLTKEKIEKIVNENYEFVYQNLNMKNNIYVIDESEENKEININKKIYLESMNNLINRLEISQNNAKKVYEETKKAQEYFETQIENLQKENNNLAKKLEDYNQIKNRLEEIENSKTFKFVNKINNILKNKK